MISTPFCFSDSSASFSASSPRALVSAAASAAAVRNWSRSGASIRPSVNPLQNTPSAEKLCWVSE